MKTLLLSITTLLLMSACASKKFDVSSYERQNSASQQSLNTLDKE